jgi:molybdopterin-biosynthesis enzyme MoeA-like protein
VLTLMVGQPLKRIEVIADDEDEIIEAVRRMSNNYDFVVTSGGIGPTYAVPGGDIGFD